MGTTRDELVARLKRATEFKHDSVNRTGIVGEQIR